MHIFFVVQDTHNAANERRIDRARQDGAIFCEVGRWRVHAVRDVTGCVLDKDRAGGRGGRRGRDEITLRSVA